MDVIVVQQGHTRPGERSRVELGLGLVRRAVRVRQAIPAVTGIHVDVLWPERVVRQEIRVQVVVACIRDAACPGRVGRGAKGA